MAKESIVTTKHYKVANVKKSVQSLSPPKSKPAPNKIRKAQYKKLPVLNSLAPSWGTIHPEQESSGEVRECAAPPQPATSAAPEHGDGSSQEASDTQAFRRRDATMSSVIKCPDARHHRAHARKPPESPHDDATPAKTSY